jgi:hypothetical protein
MTSSSPPRSAGARTPHQGLDEGPERSEKPSLSQYRRPRPPSRGNDGLLVPPAKI